MSVHLFSLSLLSLVLISTVSMSTPFSSIDDLHKASKSAGEAFQSANPDHVMHFVGYKTWKSGGDAKVKIYVNHGDMNMEFNYVCHKHDTGSGIECHAQ